MKDYSLAVIIPCWNCELYIRETLECLLKQSFSDWKAFLVDDGCTDGTAAIILEYSKKDVRFNYILRDRKPKGAQTCRNIGLELSYGAEFVVFFDADDLVAPYCFEQRVSFLQDHSQLDFAVFPAKAFKKSVLDETDFVYGVRFIENDLQAMLNWNLPMVVWNNIYRRQSLIAYDLRWDERLLSLQDSDFNIQAMVKGMRYEYAYGKVDYFYRLVEKKKKKKIRTQQHNESHAYLLDKTLNSVSSFSSEYDFFLRNHVLLFMPMLKDDKAFLMTIYNSSWVRSHWMFRLKLLLLLLMKFRGKKYLFKKELRYSGHMTRQWIEFMKKKAALLRACDLSSFC